MPSASPNTAQLNSVIARSLQSEQIEDLLKLQQWGQKITSILDLDLLIDQVVNHAAVAFGCVEANLYLYDEEHGELELTCVCGCTVYGKGHRLKVGKEGMVGHAGFIGQMHYAPDVRVDPYYIACEEATLSEVAIPLLVDGKLIGVFSASHPELDAFPAEQLRMLQGVGDHIAVALHNA
ncbi:MAG: sensor signal transduction histidine kinase, partial [Acidobacteriaceae bacterium]|nr:sensor signal transduction histidine kinase [Acidobacteriaceae bacterium]